MSKVIDVSFFFFGLLVAIVPLWLKRKLSTPKGPTCPEVTHEDRQVQNVVVLTLQQSHKYPDCLIMPEKCSYPSIHPSSFLFVVSEFLDQLACYRFFLVGRSSHTTLAVRGCDVL